MRRIKLIVAVGFVMVSMLALTAGPAMANDFDDEVFVVEDFDDGVFFLEDGATFDELCSPGLDIFLPGCIFSDEEDFLDEDEFDFVLADDADFFDEDDVDFRFHEEDFFDDNHNNDNHNNDNEREVVRVIDRG
jgi:hypothetical protein